MDEIVRPKRYSLQLKLINKWKIEFINLLTDDLDSLDKVTSICYTKEKFLKVVHPFLIDYILDNYERGDLVITYKQGDYLNELDVLQKEWNFTAYITREEIKKIIDDKIRDSKQINGKKIRLIDYYKALAEINHYYTKLNEKQLDEVYLGQKGKRVAIQALLSMGVIKDKSRYIPTKKDIKAIQDKLFEIYNKSVKYINLHSQMTLVDFSSEEKAIKNIYCRSLTYNILPYLRKLREDPDAEYFIDASFYPENLDTNIEVKDCRDSFADFDKYMERVENLENKLRRHNNYQKDIEDIYLEKINEYITRYDRIKVLERSN
ncbi:MAG TPA: hypothetical protein PKY25_00015 [Bacilli bacterium]|nr:hypothetical protein [Bacilli bacterium]